MNKIILIDDITSVIILIICHWSVNNSLFYSTFIYKIISDFILSVIQKTKLSYSKTDMS